jgi:hypothetical protein
MYNEEDKTGSKQNSQLDSRVGRLEGVVQTLSTEVQEITRAVRAITDSLGTFKEDVLARLGVATAPKWPLIASLVTMLLTIFGLCTTIITIVLMGQSDSIYQNRESIIRLQEKFVQIAYESGEMHSWRQSVDGSLSGLKNNFQAQDDIIRQNHKDFCQWRLSHSEESSYAFGRLDTTVNSLKCTTNDDKPSK